MAMRNFYKNKRIFITGHTGFKGSWLCEVLLNFGAIVGGYALTPKGENLFDLLNLSERVKNFFGDVRDGEKLKNSVKEFSPYIIIHMAAQPLVLDSYKNPAYTYDVNVMGTVNILEAVRECESVRSFLNVTTDKVYLNREWVWGYRENETLCGYDPYSNSKSCSELVTYSYKNSFFKNSPVAISTARSGNVIGGGDFAENRIIPDCMRSALKGEKIFLRNPNSIRPYQHVLECLKGYLLLCMKQYEDKNFYEGNYNFGPDENSCVTTRKIAELFVKNYIGGGGATFLEAAIQDNAGEKNHEAGILKLDCSKARTILNWQPEWNIEQAVQEITGWLRIYASKGDLRSYMDDKINGRRW